MDIEKSPEELEQLEELKDLRKFRYETWLLYEKELTMWRNKYLDSFPDFVRSQDAVKKYFLIASPEHVLKNGPLNCVKDICKIFICGLNETR